MQRSWISKSDKQDSRENAPAVRVRGEQAQNGGIFQQVENDMCNWHGEDQLPYAPNSLLSVTIGYQHPVGFDAQVYIADRSRGLSPGVPRILQAGVRVRF